jgi:hypothetical protein
VNDAELDALLAAAARIDDAELAHLPLSGPDADLCEAIMSTPVTDTDETTPNPAPDGKRRWLRPGRVAAVGAAAALVAAVAITGVGPFDAFGADDGPAWAAESEAVAESVPRLLIAAEGWRVVRAPLFVEDEVNLIYRNADGVDLLMSWHREPTGEAAELGAVSTYESRVETWDDERPNVRRLDDATVAGRPGVVFVTEHADGVNYTSFSDQGDFLAQVAGFTRQGDGGMSLETSLDEDDFREVLASIELVDIDTWLAAMPHDVTMG